MQEEELLEAVQRRTGRESTDAAYTVIDATLAVLGQRLTAGEAENLASQLPGRFEDVLTGEGREAEEFGVEGFLDRVSEREHERSAGSLEDADAEGHVRAVMTVLGNAVSGSELEDARDQLPAEFESLFEPIDMSEQQL